MISYEITQTIYAMYLARSMDMTIEIYGEYLVIVEGTKMEFTEEDRYGISHLTNAIGGEFSTIHEVYGYLRGLRANKERNQ